MVSAIWGPGKSTLFDRFCAGDTDEHMDIFLRDTLSLRLRHIVTFGHGLCTSTSTSTSVYDIQGSLCSHALVVDVLCQVLPVTCFVFFEDKLLFFSSLGKKEQVLALESYGMRTTLSLVKAGICWTHPAQPSRTCAAKTFILVPSRFPLTPPGTVKL